MKNLIFVRHAKSSWNYDVSDYFRPLKNKGIIDAQLIAKHFLTYEITPDLIITSGAKRAKTTAEIFNKQIQIKPEQFLVNDALYDFSGGSVLETITSCSNNIDKLMLFGHNHAFTSLVNRLGDFYIDNVPTCGLVSLTFKVNKWPDVSKGKTNFWLFPKTLR